MKLVSEGALQGEPLVCINSAIVATVHAEVESGSTFRETCQAKEVRKSFTKPTMLHGANLIHSAFTDKFQLKG